MNSSSLVRLQSHLANWLLRKTLPSAVRRAGDLPISLVSDIGYARNENQDRVAVLKVQLEPNRTFVVVALSDGMGGMVEGAVCASQSIASFFTSCIRNRNIEPSNCLNIAAQEANKVIYDRYKGEGGSTLSAILIDCAGKVTGVNIGDSRIYSYSKSQLEQITVDDTIEGIRPNKNNNLYVKNELLQYVGMGDGIEPHIFEKFSLFEQIILTSDGAHYLNKDIMQMVIQNANDIGSAVRRLNDIAKWCGGHDNVSIAITSSLIVHPKSSDNFGYIQVWDPFGEVVILFGEDDVESGIKEEIQKKSNRVQKKISPRKRTAKIPKKEKHVMQEHLFNDQDKKNDNNDKEPPKLNIYFNNKIENE